MKSTCPICKKQFVGRSDKRFCSLYCKNDYHLRLRRNTREATNKIDNILHRNRSILLEVMGKNKTQLKVPHYELDKRKFNFNYITGFAINKQGKTYRHLYDFSYMTFSDDSILIVRR